MSITEEFAVTASTEVLFEAAAEIAGWSAMSARELDDWACKSSAD
jgi:hypothetical protein